MINKRTYFLLGICFLLSACAGRIVNYSAYVPVNLNSKIAVIPFSNYTETPLAGERAMSITAATLESGGFAHVVIYQQRDNSNTLLPGMSKSVSQKVLLQWASRTGSRYLMTGSVNEWTYKVGLDGEPAVGLSLQLIDLRTKRIVWTAVGSQSGFSRMAVSTVAQELINTMLKRLFKSGGKHAR